MNKEEKMRKLRIQIHVTEEDLDYLNDVRRQLIKSRLKVKELTPIIKVVDKTLDRLIDKSEKLKKEANKRGDVWPV